MEFVMAAACTLIAESAKEVATAIGVNANPELEWIEKFMDTPGSCSSDVPIIRNSTRLVKRPTFLGHLAPKQPLH